MHGLPKYDRMSPKHTIRALDANMSNDKIQAIPDKLVTSPTKSPVKKSFSISPERADMNGIVSLNHQMQNVVNVDRIKLKRPSRLEETDNQSSEPPKQNVPNVSPRSGP